MFNIQGAINITIDEEGQNNNIQVYKTFSKNVQGYRDGHARKYRN